MHTLQIKARCGDPHLVARQMSLVGSVAIEQLVHVDTYFGVPVGRLMLREFRASLDAPADADADGGDVAPPTDPPRRPQLIATVAEAPAPSPSLSSIPAGHVFNVSLLPAKDPLRLRDLYARMFGIIRVVKKARTSFPFHDLMLHLDEVVGLGTFVEIHAPLGDDLNAVARARDQADGLLTALSLPAAAITSESYLALLAGPR